MALLLNSNPNDKPLSSKLDDLMTKNFYYKMVDGDKVVHLDRKQARADFLALIEEVIGLDEFGYINSKGELREEDANAEQSIRNTLKAEQRQRKDAL